MTTIVQQQLPLYSLPWYEYTAAIQGQTRVFEFYFNNIAKSWHMNVYNEDRTPIMEGIKLVPNYPIALEYALQEFGLTGAFYLIPKTADTSPDFGQDLEAIRTYYELYYLYAER